jgi:hypothetical protein
MHIGYWRTTMPVDFVDALEATVRIASIGLGVTAMELIADRRAFGPEGPFSPAVLTAIRAAPEWALVGPTTVAAVASLQLGAATFLVIAGPLSLAGRIALLTVTVTLMLLRWRRGLGGDGAEQLTTIIIMAATAAFFPIVSPDRVAIGVAFIAGHTFVSYITSGIVKLVSPVWRDGSALPAILATYYHGHPWAAKLLRDHSWIGTGLGWGIMVLWVLFPVLLLVGPYPVALAAAIAGIIFHVASAVLMGLNNFAWIFPSTYTCLFAVRAYLLG